MIFGSRDGKDLNTVLGLGGGMTRYLYPALRAAISFRTTGATFVPKSSMARIIFL